MWFLLEGWKSLSSPFDSHLALLGAKIGAALTYSSRIVRNV